MIVRLPNFNRNEFLISGGLLLNLPPELESNLTELAIRLQALRYAWGKPIIITSGYRDEVNNRRVGGSPNSLHLRARAADCFSDPLSEFGEFCRQFWCGGVGIYSGHVHLDTGVRRLFKGGY